MPQSSPLATALATMTTEADPALQQSSLEHNVSMSPEYGGQMEEKSPTTTPDVPVPATETLQGNEGVEDKGSPGNQKD